MILTFSRPVTVTFYFSFIAELRFVNFLLINEFEYEYSNNLLETI